MTRYEAQKRGSLHAHAMFWLKDCPVFNPDDPKSVVTCEEFIDKFITCKKDDSLDGIETDEKKNLKALYNKIKVDMEKIAKKNEDCSFDKFIEQLDITWYTYRKRMTQTNLQNILEIEDTSDNDNDNNNIKSSALHLKKNKTGFIFLRKKPRVIRFRNYSIDENEYDFYRTEVMLYYPWTNEQYIIENAQKIYVQNKLEIDKNKQKYTYKLSVSLNNIIEEISNKNEHTDSDTDLDDTCIAEDFKIFEIGAVDTDVALEIPTMNSSDDKIKYGTFSIPKLSSNKDYITLLSSLNDKQTKYHDNFLKLIKLQEKTQFFHFISGPGGVGKSTLLKALTETATRF
ncbi:Transcription factor tau subunit sfc3 [Frankliniella fusca]|uniref:Transcription factor tau subunit sfc3 n=1 Tax=Frankliniella fusca TaxID=407009 RepID=A0AAE1LQ97_9NEOP|nr:Transcription factor tau subunit sfc3 [Frankliniella fusca]